MTATYESVRVSGVYSGDLEDQLNELYGIAKPFCPELTNSGSDAVEGILKKYGLAFPANGCVHVAHNLYAIRTPSLPGKPQTAIEDFFTQKTL